MQNNLLKMFEKDYGNTENLLFDLNKDTPVYRIMTVENFYTMLSNSSLTFKRPKLWDDPYENFISKEQLGFLPNGNPFYAEIDMVYAQCWTSNEECDGMWRSYASLENGVKIKTTAGKLLDCIKTDLNIEYISNVQYNSQNNILNFIHHEKFYNWLSSGMYQVLAEIYSIKREEFSYEKEVRAIVLDTNNRNDIKKIKVDFLDLIDGIEFSPKMLNNDFMNNKCNLFTCLGFDSEIITKSNLYDPFE